MNKNNPLPPQNRTVQVHSAALRGALKKLSPIAAGNKTAVDAVNGYVFVGIKDQEATLIATDILTVHATCVVPVVVAAANPQTQAPPPYLLPEPVPNEVSDGRKKYKAEEAPATTEEEEDVFMADYEMPDSFSFDDQSDPYAGYQDEEDFVESLGLDEPVLPPFEKESEDAEWGDDDDAPFYPEPTPDEPQEEPVVYDFSFLLPVSALAVLEGINKMITLSVGNENQPIVTLMPADARTCYRFVTESAKDFPTSFGFANNKPCAIYMLPSADAFYNTAKAVAAFVSTDQLRPAMTGIFIKEYADSSNKVKLSLSATDAHVLSVKDIECSPTPVPNAKPKGILLPAHVVKLLSGASGRLILVETEMGNLAEIIAEDIHLRAICIQDKFPDVSAVIPNPEGANSVKIDKKAFADTLKRAIRLSTDPAKRFVLTIDPAMPNDVFVACPLMELYQYNVLEETMAAKIQFAPLPEGNDPEPQSITFNAELMLKIANNVQAESIEICFTQPYRAALVNRTSETALQLIMPIMTHS